MGTVLKLRHSLQDRTDFDPSRLGKNLPKAITLAPSSAASLASARCSRACRSASCASALLCISASRAAFSSALRPPTLCGARREAHALAACDV